MSCSCLGISLVNHSTPRRGVHKSVQSCSPAFSIPISTVTLSDSWGGPTQDPSVDLGAQPQELGVRKPHSVHKTFSFALLGLADLSNSYVLLVNTGAVKRGLRK